MRTSSGSSLGILALLAVLGGALRLHADDASWPQWRGPERNGVAAGAPALATSWPEQGPPCIWKIDGIPSGGEGGYGSPIVAGNRVYLYVHWRYRIPLETRVLTGDALRSLGDVPNDFPLELLEDLEMARSSAERKALSGRDLEEWVNAWIKTRLEEEGRRRHADFVRARLHQGEDAIPLDALERLETICDRSFPSQSSLDAWLDENALLGATRKRVLEAIPVEERRTNDVVLCLDAASGRQLWKRESAGSGEGASSTLCIADGRCYGLGSTGEAFCLDAATGRDIWRVRCGGGHSSFVVEGGRAVLLTDALTALDASTGEVVWKQKEVQSNESSAVAWSSGGSKYLICNGSEKVACVALSDGAVRWAVQGGGPSTAAVAGDLMAILTDKEEVGLLAYRITPGEAQRLWSIPKLTDRGASPIVYEGKVYAVASDRTVCVDARDGRILWEGKPGRGDICSPVLADGKLIASLGGESLAMMRATGNAFELLGRARIPLAQCSSPAFADGRLYARLKDGLACYDLAAPRAAAQAVAEADWWVAPMRAVHARFTGTPGTFAQFGDSITVSMAFWAPLGYEPKGMSPAMAKAHALVKKSMKPACWRDWKGDEYGNTGSMTIRWAYDNIGAWLEKLNPEAAVIMFGSNDVGQLEAKEYEEKTRAVVDRCLANGTIVLLTTMPPRSGALEKSREFAEAVRRIAREKKVPLIDYQAEILERRPLDWDGALPQFKDTPGDEYQVSTLICRDGVHPSNPARHQDYGEEALAKNGYALRNYVTLMAYAGVIRKVMAPPAAPGDVQTRAHTRGAARELALASVVADPLQRSHAGRSSCPRDLRSSSRHGSDGSSVCDHSIMRSSSFCSATSIGLPSLITRMFALSCATDATPTTATEIGRPSA